jgi:hypothetical protein
MILSRRLAPLRGIDLRVAKWLALGVLLLYSVHGDELVEQRLHRLDSGSAREYQ